MNNATSIVKDIITPLDQYPQINENQTIQEAVKIFTKYRSDAKSCPRFSGLLVVNDNNQLVGKLSLVDIMRGLLPRLADSDIDKFEGKDTEFPNLAFLYEEKTFAECGKNQQKPISSLVKNIHFSLPADNNILKSLIMMIHRDEFTVPVTENEAIIGMLSLEEIFNSICNVYCNN